MRWNATGTWMVLVLLVCAACARKQAAHPDVQSKVRSELDAAGLRDVKAAQDPEKGVVTLSGQVSNADDKHRAEQVAQSAAQGQVIANEIAVAPSGRKSEAREEESAVDKGIEEDFKASLISNQLDNGVKYSASQGVLTLTGTVKTAAQRQNLQEIAANVPNVKQVVDEVNLQGQPPGSAAAAEGIRQAPGKPTASGAAGQSGR